MITFSGDTIAVWVMDPNGFFVRAVAGGPANSEVVQAIKGADGRPAKAALTPSAIDAGYRLVAEVFATTYKGKRTKDGKDLGPVLFEIWRQAQDDGQANAYPDADLPPSVLEARKKWAARKASAAPRIEGLGELLKAAQ